MYQSRNALLGGSTVGNLSAFPRLDPATLIHDETDLAPLMDPYAILAEHPDITMEIAPLPAGQRGRWYPDVHVILISDRLTQAERRCTLTHELVHRTRGDMHITDDLLRNRVERSVHQSAARMLIPLADLAEALVWSAAAAEAADVLWVDLDTLQTRMDSLHPSERGYLRRRLALREASA